MSIRSTAAALLPLTLAAAFTALPATAAATLLSFDTMFDDSYGDTAGVLDMSYRTQTNGVTAALSWWATGYDELQGVAWGPVSQNAGVGQVIFDLLDPTGSITLNSFRLGSWDGAAGRTETLSIYRLGEATPAFSFNGLIGVGNQSNLFTPAITSSTGLMIEWTRPWWTAIDNIDFTVDGVASVPEPSSLGLATSSAGAAGGEPPPAPLTQT